MHVHAFSPLEVLHGATTLGLPSRDFLDRAARRGARQPAGHRGGNPRRRGARHALPGQALDRAMARRSSSTAHRRRPAHHRDHHVRPCRPAGALGAASAAHPRSAGATPAASPNSCRCRSCTWKRRSISRASARKGPTFREAVLMHAVARLVLHPLIPNIQASWVKLGAGRRRGLPRRRRQRSRRHADERKHLARRRHRARPGVRAATDGRADRLARPHAAPAHHALSRRAGRTPRGVVSGARHLAPLVYQRAGRPRAAVAG